MNINLPRLAGSGLRFFNPRQSGASGASARQFLPQGWVLLAACLFLVPVLAGAQEPPPPGSGTDSQGLARVYGEFEDLDFWEAAKADDPSMADWTDQEAWDGLSGATIQAKSMEFEIGDRTVWLGNAEEAAKPDARILAYSDGFGQYWFRIAPGTWTITATCPGWKSQTRTFTVRAGEKLCLNFWLKRL